MSVFDLQNFLVVTDKPDYAPGEFANFTVTGVAIGGTVEFQALHVIDPGADGVFGTWDDVLNAGPDGVSGTPDDGYGITGAGHDAFLATDGGAGDLDGVANGTIVTEWYVNPDDSLNETFLLTASGVDVGVDGIAGTADDSYVDGAVATTSFTDGAQAIWAWRNQPGPTLDSWDAGTTIQQANSIYAEDEVIPFRWTIETGNPAPQLQEGVTYTIQLDYAFRGGPGSPQYFFDYLTTYNATELAADAPFGPGSDLTGFQMGNLSTVLVPNDPGAAFQTAGGVFDLFNIDANSVAFGSYTVQPVNANQEDRLLNITFTPDDGDVTPDEFLNVGVAWGAHLASQVDYGFDNGAASFPGSSPQFVVDLDPSTSGDLSNLNINPNAIVAQGQITVIKDAIPDDPQDFGFTITGPDGANIMSPFTLDDDGDPNNGTSNEIIFFGLTEGVYIITEDVVSGWSLTDITGTETGADDTTPDDIFAGDTGARTATITVANGEVWTVTFENTEDQFVPQPAYTITKTVTDVDGGGPTGVVDAADDVIIYQIAVANTGNTFIDDVVVTDQVEGGTADTLTLVSGDTDNDGRLDADETIDDTDSDGKLDSAETWIYNDTYTVQQSDIDNQGGGDDDIDNTATVDSNQLETLTASASVPIVQNPAIAIDKTFVDVTDANGDTTQTTAKGIDHPMAYRGLRLL